MNNLQSIGEIQKGESKEIKNDFVKTKKDRSVSSFESVNIIAEKREAYDFILKESA